VLSTQSACKVVLVAALLNQREIERGIAMIDLPNNP